MDLEQNVVNYLKTNTVLETPLGKINIGKRINQGGTAIVHEAKIDNLDTNLVIKILLENISKKETSAYKRFKQAFINIQLCQNTGIFLPQIYFSTINISEEIIIPFTIMPFAEDTLKTYKKKINIDFDLWLTIFNDLGNKIENMHQNSIIHRDLKPENLFILNNKLVIGDCDIACFDKNKYIKLVETKASDRLGNYSFSAPEQANKNVDEITAAADWYAFGQIMYWLIYDTTIRGLQEINLSFENKVYNQIIEKLLSQEPEKRFQSFNEITDYISDYEKQNKINIQNQNKRKDIEEKYRTAIKTTTLFENIITKYTSEQSSSIPYLKTISKRNEIFDIINFLKNNCNKLRLWLSQGEADLPVDSIMIDSHRKIFTFDYHEMLIEKLILFRLGVYPGGSVIIIISKPQKSIISKANNKYEHEEVCYYKNKIITRPEYDNGWAKIHGKNIKLNEEDTKCIVRTLARTIYFISPQDGLYRENREIFDALHFIFNEKHDMKDDDLFSALKKAKRTEIIKMYD